MFLYETHCHSADGSFCGKISAEGLVEAYVQQGYTGIVLTEHFPISSKFGLEDLPWEKKVEFIENSFFRAEKRGKELGLQVFFGFEYGYLGTDIITYALSADWLRSVPNLKELRVEEYMQLAHEAGGFLVHAHPFRAAKYIRAIRLIPQLTDAVEVVNANRTDFENEMARLYAESYALPQSCGSDNHVGFNTRMCGLLVEERLSSVFDLCEVIRGGKAQFFDQRREL